MTRVAWIVTGGSLALAAVLAIALIVVVATDEDSSASGAPAPSVQFGGELPADVQQCLSEKGIEPPQAGQAPSDDDAEALRQALTECGAAPPSGTFQFGPGSSGPG